MKAHVLIGSKAEISESIARIDGEFHEAIVFVEEMPQLGAEPVREDIFAEMEPFTVKTVGADYSRQSLYTRMEGE